VVVFYPWNLTYVAEGANEGWNSNSTADRRVGEDIARSPLQRAIFYTPQNGKRLAAYGLLSSIEIGMSKEKPA